ncbi:plasmid stabilization protein [Herbaspirillum sp. DW155]|uniref:plasmid replication initiator TrfA n=1 Tax=Herbaspirillum sp. DW155 TaxID=3095609 RepID=UPI00308A228D|nr:plasmid stabilization protein [Herbaspirillum sp. DW155]
MPTTNIVSGSARRPSAKRLEEAYDALTKKRRFGKLAMVDGCHKEFFWVPNNGSMRAIPNAFARSSLFGKAAKRGLVRADGETLVSYGNIVLVYWGTWLTEVHEEAWMQLMYEARYATSWQRVQVRASNFLRALGKSNGGGQYAQLEQVLKTLENARFTIRKLANGLWSDITVDGPLHFLSNLEFSKGNRTFSFQIDPRWIALFENNEYVRIDWKTRLSFGRNQSLAKALQSYIGSSSETSQRRKVEWLRIKLRYTGPTRKFKEAFVHAMEVLEKANFAGRARFEEARDGALMAVWERL